VNMIKYECKKSSQKGGYLIIAWITGLAYFFGFPKLIELIWPETESIQSPGKFFAMLSLLFPIITVLINIEYMIYYKLNIPFLEQHKTTPDSWPWEVDNEKWGVQIKKAVLRVFLNNFVLFPMFIIPDYLMDNCPLRYDRQFPGYLEILWQMAFCMIIEDFTFYLSHRLLHTPYFYSKIHKTHHEFVESVSIAATYSHPLEFILGNGLPNAIGPFILGRNMHCITYITFMLMILHETHDGHSGYNFPWSPHRIIPFTFDAEFHIFHHWKYSGNYANYLSIWDKVFGTVNKSYVQYFNDKQKYIKKYLEHHKADTKDKSPEELPHDNKKTK